MKSKNIQIKVDWYTRVCLTVIAVLLTVLIVGLWSDQPMAPTARAADQPFGDASADRQAIAKGMEQVNAKVDELIGVLKSGDVKVQVTEPAKGGGRDASTKSK